MSTSHTKPPGPAELLLSISRLPSPWRNRYTVLRARLPVHLAARQTLQEWRAAAHEDLRPTVLS